MTFTEAATLVLRLVGKPLHFKEITDVAIERSLLSHVGKNPEVTMGARLSAQVKKNEKDNPLVRVKPGVFALAEWDEAKIDAGLSDRTPALERIRGVEFDPELIAQVSAKAQEEAGEGEAEATPESQPFSVPPPPDEDERHRAELSAAATELFAPEDDDDQPIFGPAPSVEPDPDSEDPEEGREGRRRRRRRRSKRKDGDGLETDDDLPAYTVSDAPSDEVLADVLEEAPPLEPESEAVNLAGALAKVLGSFDPGRGPVAAPTLLDAMKRAGGIDKTLSPAAVIAAAQADSLLRDRLGKVPRFRVSGGKVALTAWSFDKRSAERLGSLDRAAAQVREATEKMLSETLARMSQRAFGEVVLVLLDCMGASKVSVVKRPGTHGAELHLSARLPHLSQPYLPGEENRGGVPVAICIRRDAKDIGRERVTELRGALHHYDSASQGWLITSGQVLSGAREEAASAGGSPMILTGRSELAQLCLTYGVGVRSHRIEVPVLDGELLESFPGR